MSSAPKNHEAEMLEAFSAMPLSVLRPQTWRSGVIFASPHSGRSYPESFTRRSALPLLALRRNEDAFIDDLFACVPALGAPFLAAKFPRCIVDVNRAPDEIPKKWHKALGIAMPKSRPKNIAARAEAGLGVIPTSLGEGIHIYSHDLGASALLPRLNALYHPYHDTLSELITECSLEFGSVLLIDCHSMPGFAAMGARRPDIILGDCFGKSCHPETMVLIETAFRTRGYSVTRNYPYAGGFVTRHYGKPQSGIQAIQIEINRDLYLNPVTLKPKRGYDRLAQALKLITQDIIDAQKQAIPLAAQ